MKKKKIKKRISLKKDTGRRRNKKEKSPSKNDRIVKGIIRGKGKGYAFLSVEGEKEDFFVPPAYLNGALNGDTVFAELVWEDGELTARVTDILNRNIVYVVGTLAKNKYGEYEVIPDDNKICDTVRLAVLPPKMPPEGYKVAVKPLGRDREEIFGEITEVLGDPLKRSLDIISVAKAHGLSETFPDEVQAVARGINFEVEDGETEGRTDFTDTVTVTIDGDDTKDFDDAVSVERTEKGYRLYVHIADVSHYVKEGSVIDREAFRRGTSVYLPGTVYPMLPVELSNGICSLNPGVRRLTLSCVMDIDSAGNVKKSEIVKGVIKTAGRLTYRGVQAVFDGDPEKTAEYSFAADMLKTAKELAEILKSKREKRGSVEFDEPEAEIILNENGKTADVRLKERMFSCELIEDFMLLANETVASVFGSVKVPFVYRIHEEPPEDKASEYAALLKELGIEFHGSTPKDYARLLKSVKGKPEERAVNSMGLRAMAKAKYLDKDKGHFGLALKHYCHFTSPIRRYPDLMIHRIISAYIEGGRENTLRFENIVKKAADQSSMREQTALSAERQADDIKKAEFMKGKIGEVFEARISSVTEQGFFAELPNTVEGFIRAGTADVYPEKKKVRFRGKSYTLGSPVTVRCKNVFAGKIDFELV